MAKKYWIMHDLHWFYLAIVVAVFTNFQDFFMILKVWTTEHLTIYLKIGWYITQTTQLDFRTLGKHLELLEYLWDAGAAFLQIDR